MSGKLHLVYVTDTGYLMPTTVSLASAYAWCRNPEQLIVHIIDIGISDADWYSWVMMVCKRLPVGVSLVRHKLPENALDGFPQYRGNAATCARAYIPDLIPEVEWCFYVDGDTMFFDDPLKAGCLFDSNYAIQGHRDRLENPVMEKVHRDWFETHGMKWELGQYACAGVLLMNLTWFRKNDVVRKLINFMKRYQDSKWPDQDALYWVCRGHIKFLPDEWGMMDDHLWLSTAKAPGCLHYVWHKPWNVIRVRWLCVGPISVEWFRSAKLLTGFKGEDLTCGGGIRPWSNALGWLWRCVFIMAGRIFPAWRNTHAYRLMLFPPRFIMRHISAKRLERRLKLIAPKD